MKEMPIYLDDVNREQEYEDSIREYYLAGLNESTKEEGEK